MMERDASGFLQAPGLQFPSLLHGFGTRDSGPPRMAVATAKQVHSARVLEAKTAGEFTGEGDAIVTALPGLAVGIRTADCVPVLLADPVKRVVAAVHAGWRGTAAEIVRVTIEQMIDTFGVRSEDLQAVIGPAIGESCYEVGLEVARQFGKWNPSLAGTNGKQHVNLERINAEQLREAGVPDAQIHESGLCTMCRTEWFHSFRRDGQSAGRMLSWVGIPVDG